MVNLAMLRAFRVAEGVFPLSMTSRAVNSYLSTLLKAAQLKAIAAGGLSQVINSIKSRSCPLSLATSRQYFFGGALSVCAHYPCSDTRHAERCFFTGDADALATYANDTEWIPKWLPEWSICGRRRERGPLLAASTATAAPLATATRTRLVCTQPGHRAQDGETCSRLHYRNITPHGSSCFLAILSWPSNLANLANAGSIVVST